MAVDEIKATWGDVLSTDFVYSTKKAAWFEVIEVWTTGDRTHFRLRDAKASQTVPATTPVRIRRTESSAATQNAVNTLLTVLYSGPNGQRDAGTDQSDPFYSRIRGVKRVIDTRNDLQGRPRIGWTDARAIVLDQMHEEALGL